MFFKLQATGDSLNDKLLSGPKLQKNIREGVFNFNLFCP